MQDLAVAEVIMAVAVAEQAELMVVEMRVQVEDQHLYQQALEGK
jgi:hypothetical protein